jgi:hypothetical protein
MLQQVQEKEGFTGLWLNPPLSSRRACVLERAHYRIARIDASSDDQSSPELSAEDDDPMWMKYRVGPAGDASILGECYRRMVGENSSQLKVSSTLELWLAEA